MISVFGKEQPKSSLEKDELPVSTKPKFFFGVHLVNKMQMKFPVQVTLTTVMGTPLPPLLSRHREMANSLWKG